MGQERTAEQTLSGARENQSVQSLFGYMRTLLNFCLLLAENTLMAVGKDKAARLAVLAHNKYYAFLQVFAAVRDSS